MLLRHTARETELRDALEREERKARSVAVQSGSVSPGGFVDYFMHTWLQGIDWLDTPGTAGTGHGSALRRGLLSLADGDFDAMEAYLADLCVLQTYPKLQRHAGNSGNPGGGGAVLDWIDAYHARGVIVLGSNEAEAGGNGGGCASATRSRSVPLPWAGLTVGSIITIYGQITLDSTPTTRHRQDWIDI